MIIKPIVSLTLFYLTETETKIHVASEAGKERWLHKSSLRSYRVKDGDVTVSVDLTRAYELKGLHPAPRNTSRVCLHCRKPFMAVADFRICSDCKTASVWRTNNPFDA